MKKLYVCHICGEPDPTLVTKIKTNDGKKTLGTCSRYHQILLRDWLVKHEYTYNKEKGRFEKYE